MIFSPGPPERKENEHIEYFKRFAAAYLRWANFNFDRIVSDVVKKHGKEVDLNHRTTAVSDSSERSSETEGLSPMAQITFGNGDYGVDTGTYGGKPAVFITPNAKRRPVGARIPIEDQGELVRDTLLDGETVLIFPDHDRCKQVADALVGSAANSPAQ